MKTTSAILVLVSLTASMYYLVVGLSQPESMAVMVTSVAAKILNWDAHAGSISAGKLADLVVIAGEADAGKEYSALVRARETDVALFVIGGTARSAAPSTTRF